MALSARPAALGAWLGLLLAAGAGLAAAQPAVPDTPPAAVIEPQPEVAPPPSPPPGPACPARQPRIRLTINDPQPLVDTSLGVDALQASTGRSHAAGTQHLGLTTSRVEWRSEINARFSRGPAEPDPRPPVPGGRPRPPRELVCAVPAELSMTLVQAEHIIRIAGEVPDGGCLFREVLAHERRHVAVNRRTLRVAAGQARAAAAAWAATAEGHGASVDEAMAVLQQGLRRAIEPALASMREARNAAHEEIDRPAEYRRLARVCPGDQALLRERLRTAAVD